MHEQLVAIGFVVGCGRLGSAVECAFIIAVEAVELCVVEAAVVGFAEAAAESTVVGLTGDWANQYAEHEIATVVFVTVSSATESTECPMD